MRLDEIQLRLREAIKNSGLTQREIADRIGVSEGSISKYMHVNVYPSLETFALLCEAIDASADDILGITLNKK